MKLINLLILLGQKAKQKKEEKALNFENVNKLLKGKQKKMNNFKSKIFSRRPGMLASSTLDLATHLKILTTKQMLQRLPIGLAPVKTVNTSHELLKEIHQVLYSLCVAEEISKKVYKNLMKSIQM